MKKFFFLIYILLYSSANASVDYDMKAITRSYPLAVSMVGTLGYGVKMWGSDSSPLYGYARGALYGQTSGLVNGVGAQVEFFPISFMGVYAGSKLVTRSTKELGSYDCTLVICNGSMTRNYYGGKIGLAAGGFFLFLDGKIEDVEMNSRIGDFAEETGTLIGKSGGDTLSQVTGIFGYDIDKTLGIGALVQQSQMDKIKNKSVMSLGITRIKMNRWTFLIGAGQFYTRQSTNHFTVMGVISWTGDKGLQLL